MVASRGRGQLRSVPINFFKESKWGEKIQQYQYKRVSVFKKLFLLHIFLGHHAPHRGFILSYQELF
jgi:hypothetical protein